MSRLNQIRQRKSLPDENTIKKLLDKRKRQKAIKAKKTKAKKTKANKNEK